MLPAQRLIHDVLATGHPAIPTGDFDFTPLLYTALLVLALRRAGVPFKIWVLPVVIVVGALIDSISDGLRLSTTTSAPVLVLLALLISSRMATTRRIHPPQV
jgi:hypothetical protein